MVGNGEIFHELAEEARALAASGKVDAGSMLEYAAYLDRLGGIVDQVDLPATTQEQRQARPQG